jgi:glycosyltransferase involved in cell wall biosynthesis
VSSREYFPTMTIKDALDAIPVSDASLARIEHPVHLSLVIPVLNEMESLALLHQKIRCALDGLATGYEVIFVDDGSTDGTYGVLIQLHRSDSHVRVIRLRRNFGQTAAFSAGFDYARGDVIVTLDADLQNDPADIPRLLDKIEEGYDIVSGWRVARQDTFLTRRLPSQIANALISKTTGVRLHDYGCSLKAYRTEILRHVHLYGEMHRFIPALASAMGIQVAEIPVNHEPRRYGRSKYGLRRTVKVFLDLLTVKFLLDYATRPAHIFGLAGMFSFSLGVILAAYLSILRLFYGQPLAERPLLLLAILLIVLGVQFVTFGLLGELTVRTYYESQNKPIYVVRDIVGGHSEPVS